MPGLDLHIYPSPILNESRILRETRSAMGTGLFSGVEVAGTWQPQLSRVEQWQQGVVIRRFGTESGSTGHLTDKAKKTAGLAAAVYRHYSSADVSVINCHSVAALPLSLALKRATGARLVYDTHELETEAEGMAGVRKTLAKLTERAAQHSIDHTFVVNDGIADWYRRAYPGISIETLYNYPSRQDATFEAPEGYFHRRFGLPASTTVFLYLGLLAVGRGLELAVETFASRSDQDWALVVIGYGPLESWLLEAITRSPNIHFMPAVPPEHVIGYARRANVGLQLAGGTGQSLSYRLSTPNKLFQYLYAGLRVIGSDSVEQRRILQETGAGVVLREQTVEQLTGAARSMAGSASATTDIAALRERYAWEQYDPVITRRYRALLSRATREA